MLPELVEGELPEAARVRVAGHLAGCRACREEESRYRASLGALAAARAPYPGDLYAGFAHKLALADARSLRLGRQMRLAGATCMLLLVVGIVGAQVASRLSQTPPAPVVAPQVRPVDHSNHVVKNVPAPKLDQPISIPTENTQNRIVVPDPKPEETKAQEHKPTPQKPKVDPNSGFMDVPDEHGVTAKQLRTRRHDRHEPSHPSEVTPKVLPPGGTDRNLIPSQDAIVRIDNSKLRVKSSYREDGQGNRTEIHVSIGAPEPSKSGDK